MPRTVAKLVQDLLDTGGDYNGKSSLNQFIDTATVLVDRVKTCAAARGLALTAAELELIERWLAAHCYCQSDQPYTSKSTSGASGSFQGQTGMALDSTKYGQMAQTLDYSGCLASLAKQQRAQALWLGKRASEQTPYRERD